MSVPSSNVICILTSGATDGRPLLTSQLMHQCQAGRHWCTGELLGESKSMTRMHYFIPEQDGMPARRVTIYETDKSAIVVLPSNNVMIVNDVRKWVTETFSLKHFAHIFAGKAWDLTAKRLDPSLPLVENSVRQLLIYCLGENKARTWFKEHRGIVAQPWYALDEYDMEQLIECLSEVCDQLPVTESTKADPDWIGYDVDRCLQKLRGLKLHVPTKES